MKTRLLRTIPAQPASPGLRTRWTEGGRFLHLSGSTVAEALHPEAVRECLSRLFSLKRVRSVEIDPQTASLLLRFSDETVPASLTIQQLATTLRKKTFIDRRFVDYERKLLDFTHHKFVVWRIGEELSLWKINQVQRKDFRLWHPLLAHRTIREKVMDRLCLADVIPLSPILKTDDSIKIHCHSADLNPELLKEILDAALEELPSIPEADSKELIPRAALLHVNLALAPVSDFLLPPAGWASAMMIWLINREHWSPALAGLRQRKMNLEMLYLTLGGLTLLSFEFTAASSMYWLLHFWPKWTQELRRKSQRRLLSRYQRVPSSTQVEKEGELVEVRLCDLAQGAEIILQEGDLIPGDGVVLEGTAIVDESWIRGLSRPSDKRPGEPLFASTRIRRGQVRMRLETQGVSTEAAKVASWHRRHLALPRPPRESEADRLAESLVLPTLLVGGLAFFRGGAHMVKAVIRPDYLTGPRMTEELVDLQAMKKLAPSGIVVIEPDVLDQVAEADCVVFDDSVEWYTGSEGGPSITESLKDLGVNEVILLSEQIGKVASRLAKEWGFDQFETEMHGGEKIAFIIQRRHLGRKVVYFGDCQRDPLLASHADVAISIVHHPYPAVVNTPVAILQPNLQRCVEFLSASFARTEVLQTSLTTTLVPNILAIGGGLYLNFPVGATVALTNLGTLLTYLRLRRAIL